MDSTSNAFSTLSLIDTWQTEYKTYLVKWFVMRHYSADISEELEDGAAYHRHRECNEFPRPYCLDQEEDKRYGE